MKNKKLFILVPDGVGLRNFAYGNFCRMAQDAGFDVTFWNQTPFDLNGLGFKEIRIANAKPHPMTYILKNVRLQVDLTRNIRKSGDDVYNSYRFTFPYINFKQTIRSWITRALIKLNTSESGIVRIRKSIKRRERATRYYQDCIETLRSEKPDLVFCTNHRMMTCIAPILAAQDLGIPTATFIFSWDNLPKATMALEPDYYVVWSAHMKKELIHYHEYVSDQQIFVTGTPQFEPHTKPEMIELRDAFFARYNLDKTQKYICYSGDDVTTSPNDPQYLSDVADAVEALNAKGGNYRIIFRRCPVDFSGRYDTVLERYRHLIVTVDPLWQKIGGSWNTILPTAADVALQLNTIAHSEMVVNLGSSMAFDFVSFKKPCAFINYDVARSLKKDWTVKRIYKLVHFRSMPSREAVVWLNNPQEIASKISAVLSGEVNPVPDCEKWFEVVNEHPASDASGRIVAAFQEMIRRKK